MTASSSTPKKTETLRTEVMTVTPAGAAQLLAERNPKNIGPQRKLSKQTVQRYAEQMSTGRWRLTHQGLAFDSSGNLLDGQHRLTAVVEAGVPVDFVVTWGCDRESFSVLDNGMRRQAAQLLDHSYAMPICAAARYLGPISGSYTGSRIEQGIYGSGMSTDEVLDTVYSWPELARYAPTVSAVYHHTKIALSSHLAVIVLASRTEHADKIEDWLNGDGLRHGVGLDSQDPRLHLRNRWSKDHKFLGTTAGKVEGFALTCKAWNAYATGAPIGTLRHVAGHGVPKVVGYTPEHSKPDEDDTEPTSEREAEA